jgi:hypothetical protein
LLHLRAFSGSPAALICVHSYDQHHGQQDKVQLMGLGLCLCLVCAGFWLWRPHVNINKEICFDKGSIRKTKIINAASALGTFKTANAI